MSDAIARLARLSPVDRARVLARLRGDGPSGADAARPALRGRADVGRPAASFGQEQLWFLDQLAPGVPQYNVPFCLELTGPLDVGALAGTLTEIVRRHEILRTSLRSGPAGLVQEIAPPLPVRLVVEDLTGSPDPQREAARRASESARTPFDLSEPPLWRARLLRLDAGARLHQLVWVASHAVADGWSVAVLLREIAALYQPVGEGREAPLRGLPVQFADYALWQRATLAGPETARLLAYWRSTLDGCPPLGFPLDAPRPPTPSFEGRTHTFPVSPELVARLRALSLDRGVTLFTTLAAAYQALLARYCGHDDIAVGTPVAGRVRSELEALIGSFVNTVVLRAQLSSDPSFLALLDRVQDVALDAFAHADLPFGKLVEELRPARDLGVNPFCQTVFSAGGTPGSAFETRLDADLAMRFRGVSNGTVRFDFEMALDEIPGGLSGRFDYRPDLLLPRTAEQFCARYVEMLQAVADDPARPLSRLLTPDGVEAAHLASRSVDRVTGLADVVRAHAARTPGAAALDDGIRSLAYAELAQRGGVGLDAPPALAAALSTLGERLSLAAGERVLCTDAASPDVLLALARGATAVIRSVPGDAVRLGRLLIEERIDVHQASASTWRALVGAGWSGRLRAAVCTGPGLTPELARQLLARADVVLTTYGGTDEAPRLAHKLEDPVEAPALGMPLGSARAALLDDRGDPVLVGMIGVLHLDDGGDDLRSTGDHARRRSDGVLILVPSRPDDRAVLAAQPVAEVTAEEGHTQTERAIAGRWAEALGIDPPNRHDDFFALGGHSLLAAQLVAQLRDDFEVDLTLQDFFSACTVGELAEVVDRQRGTAETDDAALLRMLEHVERLPDEDVAAALAVLARQRGA